MSKPRLCEILGVEAGERFEIEDREGDFFVNGAGYLICEAGGNLNSSIRAEILCDAIKYPNAVIHKPKWTRQDIDDANAVRRLFPDADAVERTAYSPDEADTNLYIWIGTGTIVGGTIVIDEAMFPSLKVGNKAVLDEILESEVKEC